MLGAIERRVAGLIRPIPRGLFIVLVVLYLGLRLWMATLPGYVNDVQSYKEWSIDTALAGIPRAYEASRVDYPPLYLYVLWTIGRGYVSGTGGIEDSTLLTFLIKLPHVVFDLALGFLLMIAVGGRSTWGAGRDTDGYARWAALLFWLNPATLMGSAYWGQPDGVHSAFAFAAILAMGASRTGSAGALLSAGGLMKPLAAPLVPLLAVSAWVRREGRGFVLCGLGGLLTAVVVFIPWIVTGRIEAVLRKVLLDVEAMPFSSVNGHSIWWILNPWGFANEPWLGPLTTKQVGLILMLSAVIFVLVTLVRARRRLRDADAATWSSTLMLASAATTASFFWFSTHMHENHLFMAIPFLLAVAGRSRGLAWLFVAASLASFANMFLHDPDLPYRLPGPLSAFTGVVDPHMQKRYYTWLQFVGSFLNALVVGVVAIGTLWQFHRRCREL